MDVLSESDPLVRVEQFDPTTGRWSEVGRTEWQQYALLRAPPLFFYFNFVYFGGS